VARNGRPSAERLLVFLAVAAAAFVVALGPISDGDIYWHLAAGREMVQRGTLLHVDPFTVSAAGRPWLDVHWLFQLAAYAVYSVFGFAGLAVAKALLVAGGALILTAVAENAGGTSGRAVAAVGIVGGLILDRHLLPMRPLILTLVLLALFLLVLERVRTGTARMRWALVVLPILQVVWCNCQGLAPLGIALVAMYLISGWLSARGFRRWPFMREELSVVRPLAILLALCILASFVTPYGLDAVLLPLRLLARITPGHANLFSTAIAENIPPFVLARTAPELVWHFKWVLVSLALAFVLLRPRFHLAHLMVFAAFLVLALMANRNLPLFYWAGAPLVAITLTPGLRRLADPLGRRLFKHTPLTILLVLLGGELALAVALMWREPAAGSPTPFHFPVESARELTLLQVTGPVFATDQHGGFLSFARPSLRPYIDTRLVLHTQQEYADYLALFDDPARFDLLDRNTHFGAIVLPTTYPDRTLGLIWHLARSPDWHLAFTDGYEVLFLREDFGLDLSQPAVVHTILARQVVRFGVETGLAKAARLQLARLLVVLGYYQQAQSVLAGLNSRPAAQLRARAHFAAGESQAAEALARVLLFQDPRDLRSLALLAEIEASRGHPAQAATRLRQALAIDPYDPEARSLLERIGR
jgi:hypothetical protein